MPTTNAIMPHVILGDEAFALRDNMMKPFPRSQSLVENEKAIYNYRHSRARRTVENSFGILAAYFRVFFQPIAVKPETADTIITASCILFNILRDAKIPAPNQRDINDFSNLQNPEHNLIPLAATRIRASTSAAAIRNTFMEYFNGVGAVPWQNDRLNTH